MKVYKKKWKIHAQWLAFWIGVLWGLGIIMVVVTWNSCEVSNIYVKGDNNVIQEEQKEDIKIDSLKFNSNLINK
jgi:cell division septal protein FtsQ